MGLGTLPNAIHICIIQMILKLSEPLKLIKDVLYGWEGAEKKLFTAVFN